MKAVLLAAGRSKRMQPISDKNFLQFMGKSLLERQLAALRDAGFEDIAVICGAHNIEQVKAGDFGVTILEQRDLEMGMCGAVLASKEFIGSDPVLIFSSNDVVEKSAFELVKAAYDSNKAAGYILGKKVEQYFPGGYLELDEEGMLMGIVEKPGAGNEPSDMVNLVVHLISDSEALLAELEKVASEKDDLYEVALDNLIKRGLKFKAVKYEGSWQPIKFPWHIHRVFLDLFEKSEKFISEEAVIAQSAVISGEVIIEKGVKIMDNAVVKGPVYLGEGTVVATNALVRDSYVGDHCVVGFGTEVARSYLAGEVWTHSNYIGDSIIDRNVSFGAGTVTGNLRLDEEEIAGSGSPKLGLICGANVRAGVNVSFMPGIRVGAGSFVGAGIVIAEDIPENSFVRAKIELKISENKTSIEGQSRACAMKKLQK